jgi:hypothetical protein
MRDVLAMENKCKEQVESKRSPLKLSTQPLGAEYLIRGCCLCFVVVGDVDGLNGIDSLMDCWLGAGEQRISLAESEVVPQWHTII